MKSNAQMGYGALALAGLCLLLGSVANAAPTGKIDICHKAGERNQRILSINEEKDGEKHFGHGTMLKPMQFAKTVSMITIATVPPTLRSRTTTIVSYRAITPTPRVTAAYASYHRYVHAPRDGPTSSRQARAGGEPQAKPDLTPPAC